MRATAQICDARLSGDELGSTSLSFHPRAVRAGKYRFAVGTAGSACLVPQTVLPPLLLADAASELSFEGGTYNPLAPPYPFLDRVFFPVLEAMGVGIQRSLLRAGFYPAGGGLMETGIAPVSALRPLELLTRGALRHVSAEAHITNLPHGIALRELTAVKDRLGLAQEHLHVRQLETRGPGNALCLTAEFERATELVTAFGEQGVSAERVASGPAWRCLRIWSPTHRSESTWPISYCSPLRWLGRAVFAACL